MKASLILNQTIADGLDVIGDKWTILILRSAFYGVTRFDGFQKVTQASRSTLTRRLNALLKSDILYKHPYGKAQNRFEYKFTERGLGLLGPSLLAAQWESDWQTQGYKPIENRLSHTQCGSFMSPNVVCRACRQAVIFDDVLWPNIGDQLESQLHEIRTYNTQHRKRVIKDERAQNENANLASLIGDRWTLLVLIAAFFGTQRYDDFLTRLTSPPAVLSDRLKLLVANAIFDRTPYQKNPLRYNYQLTDKGKALLPFVMMLRQWVAMTMPSPLVHKPCQQPLLMEVVCDQCEQKPWPADLQYNH
jgi:DNA-binding HxlR family transcriptional regulator